jgi:hypothetical protein
LKAFSKQLAERIVWHTPDFDKIMNRQVKKTIDP